MVTEYVLDDRYQLDYRIASGGMGEVWAGTDITLNRPIAIKMLSTQHAGDEQFRARFRAEARYAASLSHPNITRVYNYGENSPLGGPYLIMELVNGEPLSAILERVGRLSAFNTMDVVAQAARALDVAHQAGIVHRDIKPGNLLIMGDGTTKITDFGIAKAREWGDPQLTATGIVMGTAMYVSPEQATGAIVTGSSDIYSLGVVAYECLAGEPPFVAEQPLAIAIMHKHDPVPPLPADVPRQVSDLVMAMLAKTPDGRPESALHVADRAEVLMTAMRRGSGGLRIFETSGLPIVPDFPTSAAPYYDEDAPQDPGTERTSGSPLTKRRLIAGGAALAVCGVVAVVALLLSSSSQPPRLTGNNTDSPSQSAKQVAQPATASETGTTASTSPSGANVVTAPSSTAPQSTPSARSGPTASPTTTAPTTQGSPTQSAPTSSSASASDSGSPSQSSSPSDSPTGGDTQAAGPGGTG
jgi:eukaryotic-like serine/threonine-protein kinase